MILKYLVFWRVSIQPKPKTGLEAAEANVGDDAKIVSIQPKPKTGLEVFYPALLDWKISSFNPAEAEDGFRSLYNIKIAQHDVVSIQPKPKTGLEVIFFCRKRKYYIVSIQPKPKTGLEELCPPSSLILSLVSIQPKPKTGLEENMVVYSINYVPLFQSSRSRRRV